MYDKGSGAKLIIAKSQAMWLGQWRANGASPFSLKLVNIKLKLIVSWGQERSLRLYTSDKNHQIKLK